MAPAEDTGREVDIYLGGDGTGEVGFLTMEEYIRRRQKTVAQYIATRSLLDLCEGLERAPGVRVGMWWWEQAGLDLDEAREAAAPEGGGR